MVNIDELRRNNWVHVYDLSLKPSSRYAQVSGIKPDGTLFIKNGDGFLKIKEGEKCNISAIPLTVELMEMCGFERIGDGYYGQGKFLLNGFDFELYNDSFNLCEIIEGNFINTSLIKYLNQLQNLYFSLAGEELEINFDGS